MFNDYHNRKVRELCHAVKERDAAAIKEMADYFLNLDFIDSGSVIIPAPQHEGYAIYTKEIAYEVSRQTGCIVADVIKSRPRNTLYEQKLQNRAEPLWFFLERDVPDGKLYFVDNVIDTGATYREACRLTGRVLHPLVYAKVRR